MSRAVDAPPAGPLCGLRVVEFASGGPAPYTAMLLSDLGADVIRIDRPGTRSSHPGEAIARGRRSIILDLTCAEDLETCLALLASADALIEAGRPGAMEKLGLGPDLVLERNNRLVYGRLSGWGQSGPLAHAAGHDINFIALSGALGAIGGPDRPSPPLNLVGGMAGGALFLAFGIVSALLHARTTGEGQVVDCAMSDGAASLMAVVYSLHAMGAHNAPRGHNMADGGAPFYRAYRCADGKWIAVGAIEPRFYAALVERAGLDDPELASNSDPALWPAQKQKLALIFASRPLAVWRELLEGTDACFAPVLDLEDAPVHPHNRARGTFVETCGVTQPAPNPRFSKTPGRIQRPAPQADGDRASILRDWGLPIDESSSSAPTDDARSE